ncbi:hypothetical protein E2542_SST21571 [Spatholobus suberectus]|nr:hypothetical protein E2542_SST21571 [Spatholobus suberectus]
MNVKGRWGLPSLQQILHHTSIIILSSAITEFSLSFFLLLLVVLVLCVGQYREPLVDNEWKEAELFMQNEWEAERIIQELFSLNVKLGEKECNVIGAWRTRTNEKERKVIKHGMIKNQDQWIRELKKSVRNLMIGIGRCKQHGNRHTPGAGQLVS